MPAHKHGKSVEKTATAAPEDTQTEAGQGLARTHTKKLPDVVKRNARFNQRRKRVKQKAMKRAQQHHTDTLPKHKTPLGIHASKLQSPTRRGSASGKEKRTVLNPDSAIESCTEQVYDVESIIDERWNGSSGGKGGDLHEPQHEFLVTWIGFGPEHDSWVSEASIVTWRGRKKLIDIWKETKLSHERALSKRAQYQAVDVTWFFSKLVQELKARVSPNYRHTKGQHQALDKDTGEKIGGVMKAGNSGAFKHQSYRQLLKGLVADESTWRIIWDSHTLDIASSDSTDIVCDKGQQSETISFAVFEDFRDFIFEHFKCGVQDLGCMEITHRSGALRGWSVAPVGVVQDSSLQNDGDALLCISHVRNLTSQPACVVYFTKSETFGILPRDSIQIKTPITFQWSKITHFVKVFWECFPIHGQDYNVLTTIDVHSMPLHLQSSDVLDWLHRRAHGKIEERDMHDISVMEMPIDGDPNGNSLFLAIASASMRKLKKLKEYVQQNVHSLDSGMAKCAIRLYSVSCLSLPSNSCALNITNTCDVFVQLKQATFQQEILSRTLKNFEVEHAEMLSEVMTTAEVWRLWRKELVALGPTGVIYRQILDHFKSVQLRFPPVAVLDRLSPSPAKRMRRARGKGAQRRLLGSAPEPESTHQDFDALLAQINTSDDTPPTATLVQLRQLDDMFLEQVQSMTESASHVQIIRDARVEGGAVEQSIEKDNINVDALHVDDEDDEDDELNYGCSNLE